MVGFTLVVQEAMWLVEPIVFAARRILSASFFHAFRYYGWLPALLRKKSLLGNADFSQRMNPSKMLSFFLEPGF
jgi:hypothetical protein